MSARAFRSTFGRRPAYATDAMVATSQPRATLAGLRAFEAGGNAVDAAIAAAAVLCVTEPMSTGLGGDAFACVWRGGELVGLDAAGPAPAVVDAVEPVADRGPRSVTVPGAVAGWELLSRRFGRLGLDACLRDAIDIAEGGFSVAPMTAAAWGSGEGASTSWAVAQVPPEYEPVPRAGARVTLPELGASLRRVAEEGASALYRGPLAEAICAASWLEESDLAGYEARWVEPLRTRYGPFEVAELPTPTQGIVALQGLALLEELEPTLANQVRCVQLALEDAGGQVRDGADLAGLLAPEHLAALRSRTAAGVGEPGGGTVYLCAADGEGTAVSFIQSLFANFGSGVVAPGTGIVLQSRGACFARTGAVEPGRRPYHTIIPGMLLRDRGLAGAFGIMGGFIQAQAHVQFVSAVADDGLDPQAALDRPRFRVEPDAVHLEEGLWDRAGELERAGISTRRDGDTLSFGGGQAILVEDGVLVGGSDPRKDGYAAGL
jgi:gamma-glutamyltranspeptidase/glutathione hydrolase